MFDGMVRAIKEVWHVNGLNKNLLSLGQIDSHGYKTHVENRIMKIVKGALVLMKADMIGANLFMLKGKTLQKIDACVASNGEEWRWCDISSLAKCQNKVWRFSLSKNCFQVSNR